MSNLFTQSITFIFNVPFAKKDEAKLYGAQWNASLKKWCRSYSFGSYVQLEEEYLPDGIKIFPEHLEKLYKLKLENITSTCLDVKQLKVVKDNYIKQQNDYLNRPVLTQEEEDALLDARVEAQMKKREEQKKKIENQKKIIETIDKETKNSLKPIYEKHVINNVKRMTALSDDQIRKNMEEYHPRQIKITASIFDSDSD